MKKILCTVDSELVGDVQKKALETMFRLNYKTYLSSSENTIIVWCELPAAQGYTNYKQPCVSLVVIEAQDGLDQKKREMMLLNCSEAWSTITGTAQDSLMISVFDKPQFDSYMSANQQRLSLLGRLRLLRHITFSFLRSKATRGLLVFNSNVGG